MWVVIASSRRNAHLQEAENYQLLLRIARQGMWRHFLDAAETQQNMISVAHQSIPIYLTLYGFYKERDRKLSP